MACKPSKPGMRKVFTPYITVKGRKIWAHWYGKTVFCFEVPDK